MQTLPKWPQRASPGTALCLLLALLSGLWARPAHGATNTATTNLPPSGSEHRCLFVVDTSKAMQRRSEATLQTVGDLVYSGLYGQLRTGDTIGLWTFNDKLQAGEFPVQGWVAEKKRAGLLTQRITGFLQKKKYENKADLALVIPSLEPIVKGSRLLTVIIVSDGLTKISGTPYDEKINGMYDSWAVQQQKARKPIVTVLRAHEGKWAHFTVTPAQWRPEFPPLPPEPRPDLLAAPKTNKPVYTAPLIVSGKKPAEPPPAPQTSSVPVISRTNPPTQANPLAPTPVPPRVITGAPPAPVLTATNATVTAPKPAVDLHPLTNTPPKTGAVTTLVPKAPVADPAPATSTSNALAQPATAAKAVAPEPQPNVTTLPAPAVPATQANAALGSSPRWIFILAAAGSLLLVILAIILIVLLRPRPPQQRISLITRSLERNQPPP